MEELRSSVVGRAVQLQGSVVTKTQEPGASRRERFRTLAGRKVGQDTGLFVVPDIVSFDDARGVIVFEHLQLTRLRDALSDPVTGMQLAEGAAHALAAIHSRMLPELATPTNGNGTPTRRNLVPLHGDFGIANVLYHAPDARLAIIDWSNAEWTGVKGDLAPPETDVAVFLSSLFHRRAFDGTRVSGRHQVARHFLAAYAESGPYGLDLDSLCRTVMATGPAFAALTRRLKGPIRSLVYQYGAVDLRRFLRGLSRHGLTGRAK